MKTSTVIIDTNVVVAGLITARKKSPVVRILDAMLDGGLPFLLSPDLLGEYRRVMLRDKLTRLHGLKREEIDTLLTELTANAIWREPNNSGAAPDPGDNHLWALLDNQPQSLLVTGDQLLLDNPPRDESVISPKECIDRFLTKNA